MKVGRNDPCPCGSGKKYKKCCMDKDQAAERGQRVVLPVEVAAPAAAWSPHPLPDLPLRPPDPRADAIYARWEEFQEHDYEGQIALFTRSLDEDLIDEESAFEMLNTIYYDSVERDERDRFDALARTLRERLPEVYAYDAHFYLDWQIANAVVAGRLADIPSLAREMAATAGRHLDLFSGVLDMLAYHGHLPAIVEAMRIAWPAVKRSDVLEWAIDDFAEAAVDYVVFDQMERNPTPAADDPALIELLEAYLPVDQLKLADYIALLAGQNRRRWALSDFTLDRQTRHESGRSEEVDGARNLYDLTVEFLSYLVREEGVPYSKGELGREQIQRYIIERNTGELGSRAREFVGPARSKKQKSRPGMSAPAHLLCPDRRTLDSYLDGLNLDFSPQIYRIVATLEVTPAWLRFLELRGLIDSHEHAATLADLHTLVIKAAPIWERQRDPALTANMRRAWAGNQTNEVTA
jgi:hypothetical protein